MIGRYETYKNATKCIFQSIAIEVLISGEIKRMLRLLENISLLCTNAIKFVDIMHTSNNHSYFLSTL